MEDSAEGNKELMDLLQKLRDDEMEHHDTGVKYEGMEAPFYGGKLPKMHFGNLIICYFQQ